MTTNWKLPSHLEPYRKAIGIFYTREMDTSMSIEDVMNTHIAMHIKAKLSIESQTYLLQRLYDKGMLK